MAFTTTAKYALRWLTGASAANDIDAGFQALAEDVDSKMAGYAQGTLAARPAAAVTGRLYRTTDTGQVFIDTGTIWIELITSAGADVWRRAFTFGPVRISGSSMAVTEYAVYPVFGQPASSAAGPYPTNLGNLFYLQRYHYHLSDLAIPSLTTKLRLVAEVTVNATAPGVSFTFNLRPIASITGASLQMAHTLGTGIASVVAATPGAGVATPYRGGEVTAPTDASNANVWTATVTPSGAMAANSEVVASVGLEFRHT